MLKLRKTEVTDTMLLSSTVAENDHPEWVANTAYTVGTYVIRPTTHRIYSCTGDITSDVPPEIDTANWNDEGPTNRWGMFDSKVSTATTADNSMTVQLQPGRIDSIAFLGIECQTITVDLTAGGESVFNATYDMVNVNANVGDWGDYFLESVETVYDMGLSQIVDLTLANVAVYSEGVLTVTFDAPGETVTVGMMVVGMSYFVGDTQNDPDLGINNFTLRHMDGFGDVIEKRRPAAKDLKCDIRIDTERLDDVFYELFRGKDDDAVWITTDQHGSMIVFGHATWRIKRKNSKITMISMQIKGTT